MLACRASRFAVFVLAWAAATLGGFVSKTFLADPLTMVRSGYDLLVNQGFAKDIFFLDRVQHADHSGTDLLLDLVNDRVEPDVDFFVLGDNFWL